MRVLQVHTTYREPGGEDAVVRSDADLLTRAGHQVLQHEAANPTGPRSALTLAASPWNARAGRAAARAVAAAAPDVAHVHNTWYAMTPAVPAALAAAGVPVVATLHNYRRVCGNASLFRDGATCHDCVGRTPWPAVQHKCYRGSAVASAAAATSIALNQRFSLLDRSVSLFLVLNEFMADVFVRGGLDPAKIRLKPNWVADPGPRSVPPSSARTVLVVGRVEALKGVDVLVDAWADAQPEGLELVVVGDGADRARLEARRVPGVRFTGQLPREQVRALTLSARALALPTVLSEGQPMTVLEAMSAGLPVLASRLGGTPQLLAPAGPDWLVAAGDVRAWADALRRLAATPAAEVDRVGLALREHYEQHHSEQAGLRGLLEAYESVRA